MNVKTVRHSRGYRLVHLPTHPFSNKNGYVPEHRLVAEKTIGKYIDPKLLDVHHINGIVDDNNPNNLMVLTRQEHRRIHRGWIKSPRGWLKPCSMCKRVLQLEDCFYKRHNTKDEYVSRCIDCSKDITRNRYDKHEVVCYVCGKTKTIINRPTNQTRHLCHSCAIHLGWKTRRIRQSKTEAINQSV